MFLMPQQQLSRCDRVMQQRLEPHIHTVLSSCALRAFDNPGEPEPSGRFLQRVREGNVDFRPFVIPGMWGTTWGTTWFEVSGQIDLQAAQRHTVELVVDLGWLAHRGPGFQAEGMAYRLDGTAIKSANPRNSWIPLISEHGERACDIDADGRFTIYIEAAANPFVEGRRHTRLQNWGSVRLASRTNRIPAAAWMYACSTARPTSIIWISIRSAR